MHSGKQRKAKLKHSKKALVLFGAIIIISAFAVSGTVAALLGKTDALVNIFNPSKVVCEVVASNNSYTVRNAGDIPAYIRATVVCTWTDSSGNIHWQKPNYTVSCGNGWDTETADGFLYYTSAVEAGNGVSAITVSTTDTAPDGYTFTVQVLSEAIQSTPTSVVADKWGVAVDGNGSISK